jgi:hypothetical protein
MTDRMYRRVAMLASTASRLTQGAIARAWGSRQPKQDPRACSYRITAIALRTDEGWERRHCLASSLQQ